jgi:outer membrane protein assembly factor BamE (lipoprotein component of BamABCDE complex)
MMQNMKASFLPGLISALVVIFASGSLATNARAQKTQANAHVEGIQQPLYSDYKSVRLGMTPEEVRARLGKPMQTDADQDYYVISENETVQLGYDRAHKVNAISIDYLGGIGAPDYKAVVGPNVEVKPDGSLYQMVLYDKLGFWVSYHRSAGNVPVVTVTIQKMVQ